MDVYYYGYSICATLRNPPSHNSNQLEYRSVYLELLPSLSYIMIFGDTQFDKINSLVCLVFYLFRYVGYQLIQDSPEYQGIVYAGFVLYGLMIAMSLLLIPGVQLGIVYAGFVLYGLMIAMSLLLIPGVQLDKRYLLLPWIYVLILNILYETGSIALLTTVHMEREKTLHAWEIVWMFYYCFKLIANCYCFACVVSQYQELSEGRGTYEYLYKPRDRLRRRGRCRDYDIDTFELPFGVHLPPYTEEDPYKEQSPPVYEHIFPRPKDTDNSSVNNSTSNSPCASGSSNNPNCYSVTVDIVWILI
ncbi:hypothetical protein FSP39_010305 [Pinctada imbricata]|uniref:Uncharacterized protein n=1 Tax=Pinctada imbricata TaxID=66713 RepID=A0AA88YI34_PINIB|nr:hypothetical protein FSP39_010305 [Pinctada imbricata]